MLGGGMHLRESAHDTHPSKAQFGGQLKGHVDGISNTTGLCRYIRIKCSGHAQAEIRVYK